MRSRSVRTACMKPFVWAILVGCVISLVCCTPRFSTPSNQASPIPAPLPPIQFKTQTLDRAIAYIVVVPPDRRYQIRPAVAESVQTVDQMTQQNQALVGINAGFFDPSNQQTTSHIILNRAVLADPKLNSRLVNNPTLKPYLAQIFDRAEFRRYDCQGQVKYLIQYHSQALSDNCQLVDAIGGGPALLPELSAQQEAFFDAKTGRDPIGLNQPNARSAIGITATQQIILVMVAQTQPDGGITLPGLAKLLKSLGAVQALNLDGGTSSAIFYQNQLIYGKRNRSNQAEGRPVKSAIVVSR
jgi:exopolysaccharide biosynthesis protein